MTLTELEQTTQAGRTGLFQAEGLAPQEACRLLEAGNVLFFPQTPFGFEPDDLAFLRAQEQADASYHKNISYRPKADRLTGFPADAETHERLKGLMKSYNQRVVTYLTNYLAPYAPYWQVDYTSFRPVEESGRKLRLRARNDLLHVDAFTTRPTGGSRILRVFINLHPTKMRVWKTGLTFDHLIPQFAPRLKPITAKQLRQKDKPFLSSVGKILGTSWVRGPYDSWMLAFHNAMKEDAQYQAEGGTDTWELPPGASWMVFTDMASHAVMSGQHAMEQTILISPEAMVTPENTPIHLIRNYYANRNKEA